MRLLSSRLIVLASIIAVSSAGDDNEIDLKHDATVEPTPAAAVDAWWLEPTADPTSDGATREPTSVPIEPTADPVPSYSAPISSNCRDGYGCLEYIVAPGGATGAFPLLHCQGHCNSGNDCADGVKCVRRADKGDKFEDILRKFGCSGDLHPDTDYCVDSNQKVVPIKPTDKPTQSPTDQPTKESDRRPRRWNDVLTSDKLIGLIKDEPSALKTLPSLERDPFKFTEMPSAMPSGRPSISPTNFPTVSPTAFPTFAPTVDPYPVNDPPTNPPSDYFDYSVEVSTDDVADYYSLGASIDVGNDLDMHSTNNSTGNSTANFTDVVHDAIEVPPVVSLGPSRWDRLGDAPNTREGRYWGQFSKYFDVEGGHDTISNKCSTGKRQSPIDVSHVASKSQCFEYHQIRHKSGAFGVFSPLVEKQILPNKLRLHYPREYFTDPDVAFRDQPGNKFRQNQYVPSADMPKRWGYQLPVTHVDIKIPSEHYLEGKQYAAEYQIALIQNRDDPLKGRGVAMVAVLFDIHPKNKENSQIQYLIEAFEKEFKKDMMECEDFARRQRRLDAKLYDMFAGKEEMKKEEIEFQSKLRAARKLAAEDRDWDPWHESIVRSVWFWGYEGSLTEPPCSEFVEWRVIREPAYISKQQLASLKNLIFNHVDGECRRTSVHSKENGVARPLQPVREEHFLFECTCLDFLSDDERLVTGQSKCLFRDRENYGLDGNIYTKEWNVNSHKWESAEEYWAATGGEPWWA